MVPLRERGVLPGWSAETTLNVAADDELLDLFRAAGCATLIIGFESVTEATLNDMDKPVNFCLTYQEAVDRIHARGMTVVGNFIVGFDTDTLAVFKQTRDFVQKTGILYPFFSILTPMPGTGLFDDMKAKGRLDHERWELYDTRHVVFEPKQMRRDELMDGYVWLYEKAYGTRLLWERVDRAWRRRRGKGSPLAEKLFISAKLAPELARGDGELRVALRRWPQAHDGASPAVGDPAQLVSVLDSYDFARFMRRSLSPRWEENYRTIEDPASAARRAPEGLAVMQWQNTKAVATLEERAARRPVSRRRFLTAAGARSRLASSGRARRSSTCPSPRGSTTGASSQTRRAVRATRLPSRRSGRTRPSPPARSSTSGTRRTSCRSPARGCSPIPGSRIQRSARSPTSPGPPRRPRPSDPSPRCS